MAEIASVPYAARAKYPTEYPAVNATLEAIMAGARSVLGDRFVGMYILGSLACADFDPQRSDIDFLVVTAGDLPADMVAALAAMHACISASDLPWSTNVEGSYIPGSALRRYDPTQVHHPALRVDGSFAVDGHGTDWIIQRWVIRERAIIMAGPDPYSLIDPINPADLRWAVTGILREWWAPQLDDQHRLHSSEYQAYATLTMCRSLYTLATGRVGTKSVAAHWAQQMLGEPWSSLIQRAAAWRHGVELDDLSTTLDFIRYTLDRCLSDPPSTAA